VTGAPPTEPQPSLSPTKSGLSTGAKAGIGVAGSVIGLAIIGALLLWFARKRKRKSEAASELAQMDELATRNKLVDRDGRPAAPAELMDTRGEPVELHA